MVKKTTEKFYNPFLDRILQFYSPYRRSLPAGLKTCIPALSLKPKQSNRHRQLRPVSEWICSWLGEYTMQMLASHFSTVHYQQNKCNKTDRQVTLMRFQHSLHVTLTSNP